ncbi:MAG: dTDP-glucose 4,6-dehydratase [Candidatus Magasanikbacteria bacterium]|nr:dTDP-glucose 4,6-dehydratase [Candidatus Magasanikbacteria bacterium]
MRFLVTGGAGFIGSHFIRYLLNKYPDCRVVNYDKLTYAGNLDNLRDRQNDPRYLFVQGDIADFGSISQVISEHDITHLVNFAAESHVDRSIVNSDEFIHTNIIGTHTLLEAVRKYGNIRLHHISTDEVYGALGPEDPPFNENSSYRPRSPYSASKAAADHLVRAYFHTYGLPVTISNCSNNYGPYQFPEKLHALFITNLLEGKKVPLYGDGLQVRDWLYVEDHCAAIDAIVQRGRPGDTYCVGGGCEKTNLAIARKILALLGRGEEMIEYVADRPGHDRRYAIDYRKIQRELGWAPQTDWETGMKKTVAWYRQNTAWWKKLKINYLFYEISG